ncbi:MAG: glycosyltransferase family 1 protein [Cardiobacterium sp.]
MKVLLIAPKDSPTYLQSLYVALRVQVGTCDLYALNDKQSAALQEFFNHFVKLQHYDRIVLAYNGDYISSHTRFLRTLPSLAMLRLEYDPPEARRKMKENFFVMPWLRWIGNDLAVATEYGGQGHDIFWVPQIYDPEHFFARPETSPVPTCHIYDGPGDTLETLRAALAAQPLSLNPLDKTTLWQDMSRGLVAREDFFLYIPEHDHYDPTPMIQAMACGAVVLTPDPGNDIRLRYRWRDMHDVVFFNKTEELAPLVENILAQPHRHTSLSQHAISRAKTFQPQIVGKRIGEYLETPIRDPANYPKSERIFGWEFRFKN